MPFRRRIPRTDLPELERRPGFRPPRQTCPGDGRCRHLVHRRKCRKRSFIYEPHKRRQGGDPVPSHGFVVDRGAMRPCGPLIAIIGGPGSPGGIIVPGRALEAPGAGNRAQSIKQIVCDIINSFHWRHLNVVTCVEVT